MIQILIERWVCVYLSLVFDREAAQAADLTTPRKLLRGGALGADFAMFAAFLSFLARGAFLACPAYRLARSLFIRVW